MRKLSLVFLDPNGVILLDQFADITDEVIARINEKQ